MNPVQERARRRLVALITFIYLLLIFEGALRKWVMPSMSQALFFIRDPFVIVAYVMALRSGFFPRNSPMLLVGVGLAFFAFLLVVGQVFTAGQQAQSQLLLAGYGFRNYFLYIPLAFVIGEVFQRADLARIAKITLLIAIPTAVLMFLQFVSPIDSPINVGFGAAGSEFRGLTIDAVHTRAMGLFTSDLGQREFTASAFALVLSAWLAKSSHRLVKLWMLLPATAAVLACLAIGGSRGAMLASGIILIGAISSALIVPGGAVSARAVLWPSVIAVLAGFLWPILLPDQYDAFMSRWDNAARAETAYFQFGIFGRALYGFYDFFQLIGDAPLMGYGLGLAGNARLVLGVTIPGFEGWAENDWARHIVDLGPFLGVLFILYRIVLVWWLGTRALGGARRERDPTAILLFAYVGVELLYGQISGHGTVNGYSWLFTGFCLAAAGARVPSASEHTAALPVNPRPRFANLMR